MDAKYTPSALRKRLQEDLPDETDSRVIEQRRKQIKETAKLERKAEEDRIRSTEEEDRIAQAPVQVPGFPGVYDVPYLAPQLGPRPVNKEKAERKRRALTVVPKQVRSHAPRLHRLPGPLNRPLVASTDIDLVRVLSSTTSRRRRSATRRRSWRSSRGRSVASPSMRPSFRCSSPRSVRVDD